MTTAQWEKLKDIFGEALEQPRDSRDAFVLRACAADPELLAEVQRLLAEYERQSSELSRPALGDTGSAAAEHPPRFSSGQILTGRFRVVRFIARGGMGEVYEAEDLHLGEHVALKTIRPEIAEDEAVLEMFKSEIQLARRVTHPNVCRIYDLEQHVDSTPERERTTSFLSMELLTGETLAHYLRSHGPLAPDAALPLIEQIARGLQAAHDAGVIHRDFKPGNVMLVANAEAGSLRAVITDFGLALPALRAEADLAAPDRGTPHYMAPEQRQGGPISPATDVYSLGLVIASMLGARRQPSEVSRIQALLHPAESKLELNLPPLAIAWERVLRRCLESDPLRRYARPMDVAEALRAASHRISRFAPRRLALAAGVLGLGAIAAVLVLRPWQEVGPWARQGATVNRQLFAEGDEQQDVWNVSPDGRFLAVTEYPAGDLALRNVRTGKMRRLTDEGRGAIFSPAGDRIAYLFSTGPLEWEVHVIGLDGTGDRLLYKNPQLLTCDLKDWSSDGRRILARFVWRNHTEQIGVLSVADGSVSFQALRTELGGMLFSRDGKGVIFDALRSNQGSGHGLYMAPFTGGRELGLIQQPSDDFLIAWSPDRSRLIFSSNRRGDPGLWAAAISDSAVIGEPQELRPDIGKIDPLGITQRGSLYYRLEANGNDLFTAVLDLASGKVLSPPERIMRSFLGVANWPAWSADGQELASGAARSDAPALLIHSLATGQTRVVQVDLAAVGRPQWHPASHWIDVLGQDRTGQQGHFKIDPVTGKATLLISFQDLESQFEGVWSPDGKVMFNRFTDWPRGIFRLDLATRQRTVLYVPPPGTFLGLENLALSPDGRTLAFQARQDAAGTSSLMLVPTAGGAARPLLTVPRPETFVKGSFAWMPDSRQILAVRTRGEYTESETGEIWRVAVDGSPPVKVNFPSMSIRQLRMNPDGKTIAFMSAKPRSEIWVLENFLPRN